MTTPCTLPVPPRCTATAPATKPREATPDIPYLSHPLNHNHATRTIPSTFWLGQRIRPDFGTSILRTSLPYRLSRYWTLILIPLERLIPRRILLEAYGPIPTRTTCTSRHIQMSERRPRLVAASVVQNQTPSRHLSRKANDAILSAGRPLRIHLKPPARLLLHRANPRIDASLESSKIRLLEPRRSARRRRRRDEKR